MSEDSAQLGNFAELDNEDLIVILQKSESTPAQKGSAATEIYQRLFDILTRYSRRLFTDPYSAEANALEALESALVFHIDQFKNRGPGSFSAWIFRITHNLAINQQNKDKRLVSLDEEIEYGRDFVTDSSLLDLVIEEVDFDQLLTEAELGKEERIAAELRLWHNLRPREIAETLGIETARVYDLLSAAKRKLGRLPLIG